MSGILIASIASVSFQSPVIDFRCGETDQVGEGNVASVYNAYLRHSVVLIGLALKGDAATLAKAISPNARFATFHGDVGSGPRTTGPEAAVEFFKELEPTSYQTLSASAGPFSTAACGPIKVEVLLLRDGSNAAALVFRYEGGVLRDVTGSSTTTERGTF